MSVLYKALARAAKANESLKGQAAPGSLQGAMAGADGLSVEPLVADPSFAPRGHRRWTGKLAQMLKVAPKWRRRRPVLVGDGDDLPPPAPARRRSRLLPMLVLASVLLAAVAGLAMVSQYGDEIEIMVAEMMGNEPPRPVTPVRRPPNAPPRPGVPASAPAGAPAPAPATQTAAAPPAAAPAASPATPAKRAPADKPAGKPADAVVAEAVIAEVGAPDAAKPAAPSKSDQVIREAGTNLPGVLDRIRRQKPAGALKDPVEVKHPPSASPATTSADTPSTVTISRPSSDMRDDVEAAYTALMRGQFQGAATIYGAVLEREPRNVAALVGRGTALHKLQRLDEARRMYDQALAVDPTNREALTNLLALIGTATPQEALGRLKELGRANPSFSPIQATMATVYARLGDVPAAIASLQSALSLAPDNLLYRFNLAVLQDRAGMGGEAMVSYQTVLAAAGRQALPIPEDQIRARLDYLKAK